MEQTLQALAGILVRALPTLFLFLLLHLYLKRMFFTPLESVLKARYEATEGARKQAQASFERASEKARQYEDKLRTARAELFREQEAMRKTWRDQQAEQVSAARERGRQMVARAKEDLSQELESARTGLREQTEQLAAQIVSAVLERRPAA